MFAETKYNCGWMTLRFGTQHKKYDTIYNPLCEDRRVQDTWAEIMGLLPVITDLAWYKESLRKTYQLVERNGKEWKHDVIISKRGNTVMSMPNSGILYVWILTHLGILNGWILPWIPENLVFMWELPYWKHPSLLWFNPAAGC